MKLSDSQIGERPTPREMSEIFEDLRVLAQSDGALHSISSIIYRDWVLTVDMKEGKVVDDAEQRWSTTKLNKNELMLLLGLTVQSSSPQTFSVLPHSDDFLAKADCLLREFHDRLMTDYVSRIDVSNAKFAEGPDALSAAAREAIYYGAETFTCISLSSSRGIAIDKTEIGSSAMSGYRSVRCWTPRDSLLIGLTCK